MERDVHSLIKKLSSRSVLERKRAIKDLANSVPNSYLTRLSLYYVSTHDPSYTVRNIARQTYAKLGVCHSKGAVWDKSYLF